MLGECQPVVLTIQNKQSEVCTVICEDQKLIFFLFGSKQGGKNLCITQVKSLRKVPLP